MRGHTWRRQRQPAGRSRSPVWDPVVLVEPLKALRKIGSRDPDIRGDRTESQDRYGDGTASGRGSEIDTGPYPGFPTDLQSVFLAVEAAEAGRVGLRDRV